MRSGSAFTFMKSLIGDTIHVVELTKNPPALILETALESIDAASSVFSAIAERRNTELLDEAAHQYVLHQAQQYAAELASTRVELEIRLKKEKKQLQDARFRSESAIKLAKMIGAELDRTSKYIQKLIEQYDENDENIISSNEVQTLYEIQRRTMRDYNRITSEIAQGGK